MAAYIRSNEIRILAPGNNWVRVGALIALGMTGYYSRLGPQMTVAVVSGETGPLITEAPGLVARGAFDIAITSPTWYGQMAAEGRGLFSEPLPLTALAVLPHDDRMVFAVREETGLSSLREVARSRFPLKISMPPLHWRHPASIVADHVLRAYGSSIDTLLSAGSEILGDRPRNQIQSLQPVDPSFDAIFDEAIMSPRWHRIFERFPMKVLAVDDDVLDALESRGMTRALIRPHQLPGVQSPVATIDFSGWLVFCRSDLPDDIAYHVVAAIDEQKDAIRASFPPKGSPLTSDIDMHDIAAASLPLGLHPGAARYFDELPAKPYPEGATQLSAADSE